MTPIIEISGVSIRYPGSSTDSVSAVSLSIEPGERFGLVGESGSGKSSLVRALLGLVPVASGEIKWQGKTVISPGQPLANRSYRRDIQMVFQDPYNSLHPRLSVQKNLLEPLKIHGLFKGQESIEKTDRLLERVGLDPHLAQRYPHQLSGGQLQRVGIARALLTQPSLLLADEPVSALDVSVQAQVINLLSELSQEEGLGLLLISHDLAVVRHLCQRVAVMKSGSVVECGTVDQICFQPSHPYTASLVKATVGRDVKF